MTRVGSVLDVVVRGVVEKTLRAVRSYGLAYVEERFKELGSSAPFLEDVLEREHLDQVERELGGEHECPATWEGWVCTRKKGHTGNHEDAGTGAEWNEVKK